MKNCISIILTAAIALTLAACTAAPDPAPLATPTPEPTAAPAAPTPAPAAADFYTLKSYDGSFDDGTAYYEFTQRLGYALLLKTDYAAAVQSVCCAVPGCAHDTDACPAYFPGRAGRYRVVAAGDTVYVWHISFFYDDQSWDDYWAEKLASGVRDREPFDTLTDAEFEAEYRGIWTEQSTPPCLYAVDPAAGKTRTDLPLTYRDYTVDVCDGSTLYGEGVTIPYRTQVSPGRIGPTPGCRISLADGAVQTFPLLAQEQFLDVCGDALVTSHIVTDAPLPTDREQYQAAIQSAETEYDLYDPNDGTRTRLAAYPYDTSALLGVYGGKAYFEKRQPIPYAAYEPVAVETLDIATGTTETIWTPEQGAQELPLGDAEGHSLRMSESDVITSQPVGFHAAAADGRWLVTTGKDETTNRENYALVEPEQFMAGSAEQETVTMWQG